MVILMNHSSSQKNKPELSENLKLKNIKIIGCGGAGIRTISRLIEGRVEGPELIAANTDAENLFTVEAHKHILLGWNTLKGHDAFGDPEKGEKAAKEADEELKNVLQKSDVVIIVAGMGGGTGTGSAPYIAKIAREVNPGKLVIGVAIIPFFSEDENRMNAALYGLEKLKRQCNAIIVLENDTLLSIVPRLNFLLSFKILDEVIINLIKILIYIFTNQGLIKISFSDLKEVIKNGKYAAVSLGNNSFTYSKKIEDAMNNALDIPFMEVDIRHANGAIVIVLGNPKMNLSEVKKAIKILKERIDPDANVKLGVSVDPSLDNEFKIFILLTNVKMPYISYRKKFLRSDFES